MSKLLLVLVLFATAFSAKADQMTLYFFRSAGINWRSPATLARSVLRSELTKKKRKIGHVSIELNCSEWNGKPARHFHTGMIQSNSSESRDLILKKRTGLGILFYNFKGELEPEQDIVDDIETFSTNGRLSFLTFEVSPEMCQRAVQYKDEFEERGYSQSYGLPNRPLFGEGAGCSAFGASFLEVMGLLNDEYRNEWTRSVRVKEVHIGFPVAQRRVSLFKLMIGPRYWANSSQVGRDITFWDPDLMYDWVVSRWEQLQSESELKKAHASDSEKYPIRVRPSLLNDAYGLIVDERNAPVPQGGFWKKDQL